MNTIMMNMNCPGSENELIVFEEYSAEVLFSGWNPQVFAATEQTGTVIDRHSIHGAGLESVDVESFLQKMYEYQS
jgi:hypothetical protein